MDERQLKITTVEKVLGYTFPKEHKDLIWDALHYFNSEMALGGGIVLKLVIVEDCLAKGFEKGAISDYQSRVETITNLDQIGRKIGLDKCIVPHQASKDQAVARKTMVEALKAVLWAVYVSSGKTTAGARAVMNKIGLWPDQ